MITNSVSNKPRGYAFVEYEHERDMHGKCLFYNHIGKKRKLDIVRKMYVASSNSFHLIVVLSQGQKTSVKCKLFEKPSISKL